MSTKTRMTLAATTLAALMSLSAAHAASDHRYGGQSARAGTSFDTDQREAAGYYGADPVGYYEPDARDGYYEPGARGGWHGSEDNAFDRAARPGRQR